MTHWWRCIGRLNRHDLPGLGSTAEPVTLTATLHVMYMSNHIMGFRYRWQAPMFIGGLVLWALFKFNFLSTAWNIAVGLVVTAVLFVVTGLINDGAEL